MKQTQKRVSRARRKLGILSIIGFLLVGAALSLLIGKVIAAPAQLNAEDWDLELAFFDSTVDNGLTPITNEQWNISSSPAANEYERIVTMQVTYRNENVDRDYAASDAATQLEDWITWF